MLSQAVAVAFLVAVVGLSFLVGRAAWRLKRRAHAALDRWQDDAVKRFPLALAVLVLLPALAGAEERLQLVPLEPCRLFDTRVPGGQAAPEPGVAQAFTAVDLCGIPFEAKALQANVTIVNTRGPGFLSLLRPSGRLTDPPNVSTSLLSWTGPGQTIANAAFVMMGSRSGHSWDGSFWYVAGVSGCDVVFDVVGYYVPAP